MRRLPVARIAQGGSGLTLLQIVVLALVQGITEFLPVSSSGHLVLTPVLFGWPDQGLALDVAVHVGTFGAVTVYLWRENLMILRGLGRLATGRVDEGARLAFMVAIASIPVMIAGFLVMQYAGDALRDPTVIGWSFIGFGVLLYLCDRTGLKIRRIPHMTAGAALWIGIAQAFALIPGASRAGTTISMARLLGFERADAARFSMLLSIPAIVGAGVLLGREVVESGDPVLQANVLLAAALAFVAALVAIVAMMYWLQRQSYTPFVVYRIVIGAAILWFAA
jgi:undecaprenyl-diphosphatase